MKRKKFSLRNTLRDNRYSIAAFFATAVIILITYAARGIYPFGDRTVLRVDLFHQYAPYLEEMRSRVVNGQNLLYSWEGGLGKDFLSQMAYYTTSPLNLLVFLFPPEGLPELVALLILLKVSLAASTFSYYVRKHFGTNDLSVLLFGLLYACCAYVTCYYWNIMWLDTVVLFPLVVLGVEQLIERDRLSLYYGTLTLTMIVNFYLAVLVCIVIALFYLVRLFSVCSWKEDRQAMIRKTVSFAALSLLSAMTSLFILAPVASALTETEVSGTAFPEFTVYSNILQFIPDHFLGARAAVLARNEDLPNIYCGVLTLVLLPAYAADRTVPRRKKVLYGALLLFMLLSCCVKPLDFLIHGMHFPANLPHRFAFMYSFFLLYMAYHGFLAVREGRADLRVMRITCILYMAGILVSEYLFLHLADDIDRVLSDTDLLLNAALLAAYCLLFRYASKRRPRLPFLKHPVLAVLTVLVLFECQFSFITNLDDVGERAPYTAYMANAKAAVAEMDEAEDGGFYRAEFRRFTTINDASLYHYNGFSQFSSLEPGGIAALMEHLGIAATGNSFRYYDPTPLVDALFDVRYVLNRDDPHPKADKYTFIDQIGNVLYYRNERVLPLGFVADSDVLLWRTTSSQPFAVQNDFVHRAAGVSGDMFTLIDAESITTDNIELTDVRADNDFDYELLYPDSLDDIPAVHARYVSDRDQYVYLYVNSPNSIRFIYANASVREDRELSAGRSLIDVGWMTAGEPLEVDFELTNHGQFEKTYRKNGSVSLYCASYDDEVFQEAYDRLQEAPFVITQFEDTRVEGTVSCAEDGVLMTSIPYTKGWQIEVDGAPADKLSVGDGGLLGVKLPAGGHTVVFTYRSRVFLPAVLLSVAGLILSVLYIRRFSGRGGET